MIITHDTTIEEYEAWLATNPSFTDFKVAVRSTFRIIYKTIARVKKLIKRVKTKSCLAPKNIRTMYPLSYDKNAGYTEHLFNTWRNDIKIALAETQEHIRLINLFEFLGGISWASYVYNQRNWRINRSKKINKV